MTSRPDPGRLIVEARTAALRARLTSLGMSPARADSWIKQRADLEGEPMTPDEFEAAYRWILGRLAEGGRR